MKLKQMLMNFIFSSRELEELKVKHFEVTSKNTLTTPKIALTDLASNPTANGEIVMNGTKVISFFNGGINSL